MRKIFDNCYEIYSSYRLIVPSYAAEALSYYLMLILVPVFTLLAVGLSLLNIDMQGLKEILTTILTPQYANMIVEVLESSSVNTVAFLTVIISFYAISRGVGNIYQISTNMYYQTKEDNILDYYVYTFKVTFLLLILMIGAVSFLVLNPISYFFKGFAALKAFKYVILFAFVIFVLTCIYCIVPRIPIKIRDAFYGACFSSSLLMVVFYAMTIYFSIANFSTVYGPLASIVVVLFVFDWVAEVFYMGLYLTNYLYLRRNNYES